MQPTRCPDASMSQLWRDASIRSMLVCLMLFIALIGGVSVVRDTHSVLAHRQLDVHGPVHITPIEGLQRVGTWATDGATTTPHEPSGRAHAADSSSTVEALRRIGDWAVPTPATAAVSDPAADSSISESLRRIGAWATAAVP